MAPQNVPLGASITECVFCSMDFETTGLRYRRDHIIEIGAIKGTPLGALEEFDALVRPPRKIPLRITKITGIDNDMVMGQPALREVRPAFLEFISGAVLVIHSQGAFDLDFLDYQLDPEFPYYYSNTLQLARRLLPEIGKYDLASVAIALSVATNGVYRHKAVDDARLTMLCFQSMLALLDKAGYRCLRDLHEGGFVHVRDWK